MFGPQRQVARLAGALTVADRTMPPNARHPTYTHVNTFLPLLQVDLPAGSRVEYKYVIMEEQVTGPHGWPSAVGAVMQA